MAIITQKTKLNQRRMPVAKSAVAVSCLGCLISWPTAAASVNVDASVDTNVVVQQIDSETRGDLDLTTFSVQPGVSASYRTRTFDGLVVGEVTHLERINNELSRKDTYAEYDYRAQWQAIENFLTFSTNGGLQYQNANSADFLVSDFYTNSDSLAKRETNQVAALVDLSQGDWVRANGSVSYSQVDAEETENVNSAFALDSETLSSRLALRNGDDSSFLIWDVNGSYHKTNRSRRQMGNFVTREVSAFVDSMVYDDWGLRFSATHDANENSNSEASASNDRKYTSYGIGIAYRPASYRYIAITANKANSNQQAQDGETFIGLDVKWAFSPRTSLSANYGRTFFGDRTQFRLSHNLKHIRTSVSYSEQVTTFSRLISDPEFVGMFVCPSANASIDACYQPDSLNYTPVEGEQLVPFVDPNYELEDQVILRKAGTAQISYDFSRITLGLSAQFVESEYLEEERVRSTYTTSLTAAYAMNERMNFRSKLSYANIDQQAVDRISGESDNWNASVGLVRRLGRHLSANVDLSYLDKSGELATGRFGSNYEEARISAGVTYKF